jgi:lactoylglutathione lyase
MALGARLLHTMIYVSDVDRALAFYCGRLGMSVQADRSAAPGRRSVFIGYGPERETNLLEICTDPDPDIQDRAKAFGHLAVQVADVAQACETLARAGVPVTREARKAQSGALIAFIEDPDGYRIELIQPAPDPHSS